jgi:Tfp pilus assembly protein PilO
MENKDKPEAKTEEIKAEVPVAPAPEVPIPPVEVAAQTETAGPVAESQVVTPEVAPSAEKPAEVPQPPETLPAKPTAAELGMGRTTVDLSFYKVRKSLSGALKRSPRARAYTVIILTLVTVTLFIAFTIVPTVSTIISIQSEIAQKERIFSALDSNIKVIDKLESKELAEKSTFEALHSAIPEEYNHGLLTEQIQTIATSNNLTLDSVRYTSDVTNVVLDLPQEFRRTEATIIATGEMDDFISFLEEMEGLNRLFVANNVNYTLTEDGSTDKKEYIVQGYIYNIRPLADWAALEETRRP